MKFSAAAVIAAAATGAHAWAQNVTVTTDVVTAYTTYCPYATSLTMGNKTITVTAPGTITITDCPCTITRPVTTASGAWNATGSLTTAPANPTGPGANPTGPGANPTGPNSAPSSLPTAGAGKAAALSGAGLAGLVGLAAFAL